MEPTIRGRQLEQFAGGEEELARHVQGQERGRGAAAEHLPGRRRVAQEVELGDGGGVPRLVRAKRRVKSAGIPFRIPGREELPARKAAVFEAVYGVYVIDWATTGALAPG